RAPRSPRVRARAGDECQSLLPRIHFPPYRTGPLGHLSVPQSYIRRAQATLSRGSATFCTGRGCFQDACLEPEPKLGGDARVRLRPDATTGLKNAPDRHRAPPLGAFGDDRLPVQPPCNRPVACAGVAHLDDEFEHFLLGWLFHEKAIYYVVAVRGRSVRAS